MYGYSTGTSFGRMVKLSLPVQDSDCATAGRTPARQDAVAEDSIFCTEEMTLSLGCSGMMNDHHMPFDLRPFFVLDFVALSRQE